MFDFIFRKSLENRRWVIGTFLLIAGIGAYLIGDLPVDAVPDITNVQVMINTKTGALDPERIEKTVSYVIETEMSGLPGIKDIRSLSKYGLSQVILVFEDGTDLFFMRQQVSQRLQGLGDQLPAGITPELAPVSTGLGEVVMYTVDAKPGSPLAARSEGDRLLRLRTVQDYVIRPELKKVRGLAEVDTNGGYRKEIHVNADISKMESFGITFDDLQKKLNSIGDAYGGGYIQRDGKQIIVRSSSHLPDLKTLENIPIKLNFRGRQIRVVDVANVREDHTQRLGVATAGGEQAVLGTALMYLGANSRQVAEGVTDAIAKLELPADVEIKVVYTRSFLVNQTIMTVVKSLAEGAALVIVVLLLLLGNIRAAVMVAFAIPLSMLFAVIGMRYFGITANLMSLGALDFGLLVDGSVVMIENLLRRFQDPGANGLSLTDRMLLVKESALEVAKPVVLGLIIIMVVYVPILTLEGVEGKMFHPMAMTVLMALASSLIVAVVLMPTLGFIILRPPEGDSAHEDSILFGYLARAYQPLLRWSLQHRVPVVAGTIMFAVASLIAFTRLGADFIPQLDEGDLVAGLVRDTSTGIDESVKQQKVAERLIAEFPEVQTVFSRLGTPESATDPMGVNFADTFIILKKDHTKWPAVDGRRRTKSELMDAISTRIQTELPGTEVSPTQPIAMRFNEILEGSRADVALRIYGPNLDKLIQYIDSSKSIIEKMTGVSEAEMDSLTALKRSPVLSVNLNYAAMSRYGVNLQDANNTLMVAMSGVRLGSFYEDELKFPVMLHLDEALREDPEQIKRIPVALPAGGSVPLSSIAEFSSRGQVTTIARSFGKRYAALSIFLKDRDIGSFVDEAKAKINREMPLDAGYSLEWGGQFNNLARARLRLALIIPLTLIVIFLLLFRNFESLRLTSLIFSSIPLAITGGIFALYIRSIPFSISAAVGFVALLGIAILNSMVLVDFINHLRHAGRTVQAAVEFGAQSRLRPVLMTALVAGLGFLPMAMNTGLGAEVQRPLATVVIGGLITSTILTLLILPTLYVWFEGRISKKLT